DKRKEHVPASVCVVIVNYNGIDYIENCLRSIQKSTYPRLKIIVVDNASLDGSREHILQYFPDIYVIQNKYNLFFAKAANIGMDFAINAGADYLFLLNPDITLSSNCISHLTRFLEQHPEAAACQPKLLFENHREIIQSCGCRCSLSGNGWDHRMGEKDRASLPVFEEILGVTGGALFTKAKIWKSSQGFCQRFGMYYEDIDFCLRLRAQGFRFYCLNSAQAYHVLSGIIIQSGAALKYFFTVKNSFWVVLRNFPFHKILKSYIFSLPAYVGMLGYNLSKGRFLRSWYIGYGLVFGCVSFWIFIPRLIREVLMMSKNKVQVFEEFVDEDRICPPALFVEKKSIE
ncbi:MAG: glycosyltransferase family 2 protein, partial [Desulfohalobiaceae bacterium]|nr:glycosyltransferase family 2 protein [Desulfohalobiaceae bacterium]